MKKGLLFFSAIFIIAVSFSQNSKGISINNSEIDISENININTRYDLDLQKRNDDDKVKIDLNKNNCKHKKFHRISLRIGGGPYYHYGKVEFPKLVSLKFISFQGEGMLGYNFKTEHWPIHTFAFFARRGITNKHIDPMIISHQELIPLDYDLQENFNIFEEYEVGLLIGRWFRLSGGIGHQYLYTLNNNMASFSYYTFTSGFCFGSRVSRLSLNFTAAGGNDFQDIHFRLYTGINFYLNFLKL